MNARAAAVVLALLLLAFAGSWNHDLWAYDEPREAELARAAWRSGNYAYTVLNERPFLEKPPLFTVTVATAFGVLGRPSVFAARLVAAAWGLATLAVVAWFAGRTLGPRARLLAPLVLATTNRFYAATHVILLDDALLFFTTSGLLLGWLALEERRTRFAVLSGLALGGAFLTKGAVGPVLVASVLGIELLLRRDRRSWVLAGVALLTALVPAVAYVLLLASRGGRPFLDEMFLQNQVGRFARCYQSRPTHWHFYLTTWPEMLFPWTPLAAAGPLWLWRRAATAVPDAARGRLLRFLTLWAVLPLLVLSLASARSRNYALPLVPGHALLAALSWEALRGEPLERRVRPWLAGTGIAGALGVLAFCGWAALASPAHRDGLLVASAVLAAGAGGALALDARGTRALSRDAAVIALALVVVAGCVAGTSAFFARRGDLERSVTPLARQVWAQVGERRLVLWNLSDSYSGTFGFVKDRSVPEVRDAAGEQLLPSLGPNDLVLAHAETLGRLDEARRRELWVEWTGVHLKSNESLPFVLFRKRRGTE